WAILEHVRQCGLIGVVLRDHVVDEVRLDGDGHEILDHIWKRIRDSERLQLAPSDRVRRISVKRLRTMECLLDHGAVERLYRIAVYLDVVRVDWRARRGIES